MFGRFRLLPVLILFGALMLTVKVGEIWRGLQALEPSLRMSSAVASQPVPVDPFTAGDEQIRPLAEAMPAAKPKPGPAEGKGGIGFLGDPQSMTESEIQILQELSNRRRTLDKREQVLGQREALLKAAEQRLVKKQAELAGIRNEVKSLLEDVNKQERERLANLVKIYENMKPRDAAKIFNELDLPVLLGVMGRMKARKVAPVIAAMDPKKARTVTRKLAQRDKKPATLKK